MKKFKETIIIILIVLAVLTLILIPIIISNKSDAKVEEETPDTITIKVEGEINYGEDTEISNSFSFKAKYGATKGEINNVIITYLTKYSILDTTNLKTRYYQDTTIIIESSYKEEIKENVEDVDTSNLIKIEKGISISTLTTLYGIGEKRASMIIEFLNTSEFKSWDEFQKLVGVSDDVIEIIKTKATI